MGQRFVIDGDRKVAINLTLAVDGGELFTDSGWPWEWTLGSLIGIVMMAGFMMLAGGLPYYNTLSILGLNWTGVSWRPQLQCRYDGPQGHRSLWLEDAQTCPVIAFLPWHSEPMPHPVAPSPPLKPSKKSKRHDEIFDYGPAGPPLNGYKPVAIMERPDICRWI